MEPSVAERMRRLRELWTTLEQTHPADLAQVTLRAEALAHEATELAADAAEALAQDRRRALRLTSAEQSSEDTGGSSR